MTPALVDAVLRREGSPLAGLGAYICSGGRGQGIDPVFLLAFVSEFDVQDALSSDLHNVGHLTAASGQPSVGGYRMFATWRDGIDAWYGLVRGLYVGQWHLQTLDAMVPVYAAGSVAQVEDRINRLHALIASWRLLSAA